MARSLPVAAHLLSGRCASGNCSIVVSPYKFLSAFQKEATAMFLDNAVDAWIVTLNVSDFQGPLIPDELSVDAVLPNPVSDN